MLRSFRRQTVFDRDGYLTMEGAVAKVDKYLPARALSLFFCRTVFLRRKEKHIWKIFFR